MSLLFDDSLSQHLERTATIPTLTFPFAVAAWVFLDDLGGNQTIVSFADSGTDNESQSLMVSGGIPRARSRSGGVNGDADATDNVVLNTWHHIIAFFNSASDREVYLDGRVETRGTDVTSLAPTSLDAYSIARIGQLTPSNHASGRIAEVSVWNLSVPLTPSEIKSLGDGFSAIQIRTAELVLHDKMLGVTPTVEMFGNFSLSAFNGPVAADHPPIGQAHYQSEIIGLDPVHNAANDLLFDQIVGIQTVLNISVTQAWDLFHFGDSHVRQIAISQLWQIDDEVITGPNTFNRGISQAFLFQDLGKKVIEISVIQALGFGQSGDRAAVGENVLVFTQSVALDQCKIASNELLFDHANTFRYAIRNISVTQLWACDHLAIVDLGGTGACELPDGGIIFNGDVSVWGVDELEDVTEIVNLDPLGLVANDTIQFLTTLPITSPILTVRAPEFGNTERHRKGQIFKRLRGGGPISNHLTSRPRRLVFTFTVIWLKDTERDAIQVFLTETLGTGITLTDSNDQDYDGIIANPEDITQELHTNRFRAQFDFWVTAPGTV